jgi:hypothetical protein
MSLLRKQKCPHCGQTYWQGRRHACPAGPQAPEPQKGPWRDPTDDSWFHTSCCLADACLHFGCLLPLTLAALVIAAALLR